MMTADKIGLYVHIPFCISKCNYCDFASFAGVTSERRERYIARLCEEIKSYKITPAIAVDTVFFGGGTPSLLMENEFVSITEAIHDTFDIDPNAEFTLEANPKTVTEQTLAMFVANGVNRLSIGVQSTNNNELKKLGRIHVLHDIPKACIAAKNAGIDNISFDLMYGIPEQTIESFSITLKSTLALHPTHFSVYGLILEEGTPFYDARASLPLPTEDEECDMYDLAARLLSEHGYSHYEISNYAKPGFECRHNLKYWRDEEFIGVGLAAYSYFGKKRYGNSRKFDEYLSDNYTEYRYVEEIDTASAKFEYVMMRLRLREGFSLSEYESLFGEVFVESREEKIKYYSDHGYLVLGNDRVRLTQRGFYISNTILSDLL